jgi:two-component system sensor histidine kinase KdpD
VPTPLRPDPDTLLASFNREEALRGHGRLKVFFGMCPGVGKTYAMLRAAQVDLRDKRDVVIGIVETHGRAETQALLEGLPIFPRRLITHRGIELTELDLEGVLERKPQLVLVDELAHTNAPTSRHAKRYQDVIELLAAGIDVYTTLNVQHIESRADTVRQITGATVAETVPDSIIDLAQEIELVDVTPQTLRERLREGKVYLGDRAADAENNFFREAHLAALRELSLRFTAERVDVQLRRMRENGVRRVVWRSGERLLVAVGPSPFSTQLIRWTRRLAAALGAPWLAVHVETSHELSLEDQHRLDRNLSLARELGAEVIHTHDDDVAAALVRTALQHNATQMVVGKSHAISPWKTLTGGTVVDRILRQGSGIDISLVPAENEKRSRRWLKWDSPGRTETTEAAVVVGVIAALTLLGLILPHSYYLTVGLVYLLAVIILSLKVGRWPVLLAGFLSAMAWDYLFIPPRFEFTINRLEDFLLFVTYFVVALVVGQLTARVRAQARHERLREQRATALFHLTRALAQAKTLDDAVFAALRQIDQLFHARTSLALKSEGQEDLVPHFAGSYTLNDRERGVAEWSFRNRQNAGRFTDTLPSSEAIYFPLILENEVLGVLGVCVGETDTLTLDQRDLLEAFARQIGLVVEREALRAASEREKLLAESEKLHRTLLDSVSHELRTPLAVIASAVENMPNAPEPLRQSLIQETSSAARRLNRLVGNLLDQTRLESGALKAKIDWCDARDLLNAALADVHDTIGNHPLTVEIPDDLPPVRADFALMEQSLANLLLNAILHTPAATPIFVTAGLERGGQRVYFTIADRGPGFPAAMRERLFKKFSRGDAAKAGGLGLGLSIVRGFIVAQQGEIVVGENPGGGAVFTIYLPHAAPTELPPE